MGCDRYCYLQKVRYVLCVLSQAFGVTINVKAQECVQRFNHFFFYRGVQALANLSRFLKMCYFGRHITPLCDVTKMCGRPAFFY